MQAKSRMWFDDVYSLAKELPTFAVFTNVIRYKDVKKMFKNCKVNAQKKDIEFFTDMFARLYRHLPSEEDFMEEKQRILEELTPKLKERLGWVETVVSFGKHQGDVDLCLISPSGLSEKKLYETLPRDDPLLSKYPIVDWDTLLNFQCKNGEEFAEKIISNSKWKRYDRNRVRQNLYSARLMWGNGQEIDIMKSRLEQFLQN